ncbi:DUF418 domain-containing protein [Tsuneonella sp. HG249]
MSEPIDPKPLGSDEAHRITSLDFIRGIAVMGIVAANVIGFGQPFLGYSWPGGFATPPQPSDPWLWTAQFVLIDGKMRGLFSLLFGAGLALFADRSAMRGEGEGRQAHRLAWLLLFGIGHFYLLWRGDILALYAMCGFVVLFAMRWNPVMQFTAGLVAYVAGAFADSLTYGLYWRSGADLEGPAAMRDDAIRELAIAAEGTYGQYVAHALDAHRWNWLEGFTYSAAETIPLMLMGAALYRAGLFDGRSDPVRQRRWGWTGVIVGSLTTFALGLAMVRSGLTYTSTLFAVEGPQVLLRLPVILGLAALLAQWGARSHGAFASRVVGAGRAAFSNYLGTSIVMLAIFQPPGLRLFGQLDRFELYGIVVLVWAAMLLWSSWWLERFRYGPLEWLWRSLTYQKWMPFLR